MTGDLQSLKNIGPASARQLRDVGIESEADLRDLGALAAYRRLKHAFPREVSLNMLYALEGALTGCHWNRLPPGAKQRLKTAANSGQRAKR
ncbi:MAG: TfoX/Sxy family protein [Dongiaceae bacterium]